VVVAIQGKQFRDWIAQDKDNGLKLLMGMLQNTLSRLRQTSDELSVVYGIGRILAAEKTIGERIRDAVECLKNTLNPVDEISCISAVRIGKNSSPWRTFRRPPIGRPVSATCVDIQRRSCTGPVILKRFGRNSGHAAVAVVPLMNRESEKQPLLGFLWLASKSNPMLFLPVNCWFSQRVSVQFTEALLLQQRQRIRRPRRVSNKNRNSFPL